MSISSNQTTFLFKKNLGVPDTSASTSYASEQAGNARTNILSSQLYAQPIPLTVPTDFASSPIQYAQSNGSLSAANASLGTVRVSQSYPYIQYVQGLVLSYGNSSGYAFAFNNPGIAGNINLLSNAIPFNYNPANSGWNYTVTCVGYPSAGNIVPQSQYIVDVDAGYLYFTETDLIII